MEPLNQGGDARAREPIIGAEAHALADECLSAIGIDPQNIPIGWYGLAYDLEVLIKRGCDPPIVRAAFAQFAGRVPLPGKNYVLKAVQTAHENQPTHAKTAPSHPADWRKRRDANHAALDKLRAFNEGARERKGSDSG